MWLVNLRGSVCPSLGGGSVSMGKGGGTGGSTRKGRVNDWLLRLHSFGAFHVSNSKMKTTNRWQPRFSPFPLLCFNIKKTFSKYLKPATKPNSQKLQPHLCAQLPRASSEESWRWQAWPGVPNSLNQSNFFPTKELRFQTEVTVIVGINAPRPQHSVSKVPRASPQEKHTLNRCMSELRTGL